ncbi:carbamoyltransferase [Aureococcus anophagefferens]|nr:carbamoyltransferase [Aureococcus anophagefferens]
MWVLLAALTAVSALHAPRSVVLGLNKYSHNACVAVADAHTGELLFAQEKERLTRVKNDGGAVGDLVRHALAACDVGIDDVVAVVANDHHRSVASEERAFARAAALGLSQSAAGVDVGDAVDPYNAFDATITSEMSHHLAHALGAAATGDRIGPGVVVVMDGMGEERRRFDEADFHSDADLPGFGDCVHVLNDARVDFGAVPPDARECETAYAESADGALSPLVKRWCLGVPGAFFGFGDWFAAPMDSLGAAYSHVSHASSSATGAACGKSWASRPGATRRRRATRPGAAGRATPGRRTRETPPRPWTAAAGRSTPAPSAGVSIDRSAIAQLLARAAAALPDAAFVGDAAAFRAAFPPASPTNLWKFPSEPVAARACCAALAYFAQKDLEAVALAFAAHAAARVPDATRVVLCGGVGLNSVLNGLAEEEAAVRVHVPSAPGDEGCALGCAARALAVAGATKHLNTALLPYGGAAPSDDEIDDALDDRRRGRGRSSRPATRYDVVDGINDVVKGREDFRPLAPAVLEEEASKWFAGKGGDEPTPYMSRVWTLASDRAELVPACAHVDDTARPQTVASTEPRLARYRALIAAVFALTGVPFLRRARRCPVDEAAGSFPGAAASFPARKHARYALTTTVERGDDGEPRETSTLRVLDLDEPLEDAARTRRGDVELLDALDAAIYERCDGELSAAELAADLVADLDEDESDPCSEAAVARRLARLWRLTLVRLG